jgi:uncharacterized protein (TIRG00374 family)
MIEPVNAEPRRLAWGRILPGLLVSLVAVAALLVLVDRGAFWSALRQADYRQLLLAVPVYLLAYLARARAWHLLLKEEAPFRRVFFVMQSGYLFNNLLPLRLGELGRAFLLGRRGLGFWRVFSSILVERAFDLILAAGLLLVTLPLAATLPAAGQLAALIVGFVLLGFVCLHLLARYPQRFLAFFDRLAVRWALLQRLGRTRLAAFLNGLAVLARLGGFLHVWAWMAASWLLAIGHHWLVLRAFVPQAEVLWAGFALAIAALGVALPASPGSIGVYEAAFVGALAVFRIPPETALAFALVNHGLYIAFTGTFGLYGLWLEGQSLGQLFRQLQNRRSQAGQNSNE